MPLFGANGVRGVANRDLTPEAALQIGKAVGRTWGGPIAIATDTRDSADMLRSALSAGIMASGADIIDLGMLPTPALQYYVKTHDAVTGGVEITASHNPSEYNGFKFILADGIEASREEEIAISDFCARDIEMSPWPDIGESRFESGAGESYVDAIMSHVDVDAIRRAKLKVCLDCSNGATCKVAPLLLRELGVTVATVNCNPLGNPVQTREPSIENLGDLRALVVHKGADLGIAHDGDGDRTVFIDGTGRFVPGDVSLALMAKAVLSAHKGKVITPISSSAVVEEVVEGSGGLLKYTAVGSHTVVRKMIENMAVFGGEENGGMIFPEMQWCRDGGMALAKMLELIALNGPLADQISGFPVYHTVKDKIDCPDDLKARLLERLQSTVEGHRMETVDGVKIHFDDGWVLLRPSTTESVFRIYSESKDPDIAKNRADEFKALARDFLQNGL